MSSPFLEFGDSGDVIAQLQSGLVPINVASIVDQSVAPSSVLRAAADRSITSGLVTPADLSFVPLSDPATADLDMAGHSLTNVTNINGSPLTNLVTNVGAAVSGDVAIFSGSTGKIITDLSIPSGNLVTNAGTSTTNHVAVFSSGTGKVLTDGGHALSEYLPLAGGTMTGGLVMAAQVLTVNKMSNNGASGFYWGNGASVSNVASMVVGNNSAGALDCAIFGRDSSNVGTQATLIGMSNTNTAGVQNVALGISNIVSANGAIAVGSSNTASAVNAIALGAGLTNATANSVLVGSSQGGQNLVNIRPQTSATCDLGTGTSQFNDIYAAGSLIGSSTTSAVNNIVTNTGAAASGNIATFSGASGKIVTDSGTAISALALNPPAVDNTTDLGTALLRYKTLYTADVKSATITATGAVSYPGITKTVFSCTTNVQVSGTTTETTVVGSGSGSMTLLGPQHNDDILIFSLNYLASTSATSSFTLRLKVGGVTVLTSNGIIPDASLQEGTFKLTCGLQATHLKMHYDNWYNSLMNYPSGYTDYSPYPQASNNTFDITVQWNDNNGDFHAEILYFQYCPAP
jgi:hypothetical protein